MLATLNLSTKSQELLQIRKLDEQQINNFVGLYSEARQELNHSGLTAKQILEQMSREELDLLRRAHSQADPIQVSSLSEEGAINLLAEPDHSNAVDLNNDGIVEVGAAKNIMFPPPGAPDYIKQAWEDATLELTAKEKLMLQLEMHLAIYGTGIGDESQLQQNSPDLDPSQIWSGKGVAELMTKLRGCLAFSVSIEGWTEHNRMKEKFYDDFETAIEKHRSLFSTQHFEPSSQPESSTNFDKASLMQTLLDKRLGIDREKLEKIEDKIETISKDPNLSPQEKQAAISELEKQKQNLINEAIERAVEEEKRKAEVKSGCQLLTALQESAVKDKINL